MKKSKFAQRLRCLVDDRYRRAYRSLRHLPKVDYRTVIDAGANRGTFTDALLQLEQPSKIVMVEALPDLAARLKEQYAVRQCVSVVSAALSDTNGTSTFEVNEYDSSSSLLKIDPRNSEWFGRSLRVAHKITVPTITLPELMQREQLTEVDLLKLDLQGAERLVLSGGASVIRQVGVVFTEILFQPLYEGSWLFWDVQDYFVTRGFQLCSLSNIVHSSAGDLLQGNAIYRRVGSAD